MEKLPEEVGLPVEATYKWDKSFEPLKDYDGKPMTILRRLSPTEADPEVGPMYLVRFHHDGTSQDVHLDEVVLP